MSEELTPFEQHAQNAATKKEDGKAQAKQDAVAVVKDAAKGALTGGWAGAAKGAVTGFAKTKSGKKTIAIAACVALVPPLVFGGFIATSMNGVTTMGNQNSAMMDRVVVSAVMKDFGEETGQLGSIRSAASQTGVPWTILAAIYQINNTTGVNKGVTGFGLDPSELKKLGWDSTRSVDPDYVAHFVASRISAHTTAGKVAENQIKSPFAGRVAKMNAEGVLEVSIGDTDDHVAAAQLAEESWIEDLEKLEVLGNPDLATKAFELAEKWNKNGQEKCSIGGSDDGTIIDTADGKAGNFGGISMNARQVGYAQAIIDTVAAKGLPEQAAVISLITVAQESKFRMYWNSSVPGSKELTQDKDAEGGYDLGNGKKSLSVGLYQQQIFSDLTWGTVEDGMSPQRSTENFLKVLVKFGWENMEEGAAAQKVQRSAHPSRYTQHLPLARALVKALPPQEGGFGSDHSKESVHHKEEAAPAEKEADDTSAVKDDAADTTGGDTIPEATSNPHNLKVDTSLKPDIQAVQAATVKYFAPAVYAMGGYRPGSKGHSGRVASDLMVVDYKTETGKQNGHKMAAFFIENRAQLGLSYIIWDDKIWRGPTTGWEEYSKGGRFGQQFTGNWNDTTKHFDHLHVETIGNAATGGELKLDGVSVGVSPGSEAEAAGCGQSGEGSATVVSAGTDDYPFSMPGDVSWKSGSKDPGTDGWGFFKRECVSFVAWRLNQQMGYEHGKGDAPFSKGKLGWSTSGNAKHWGSFLSGKGYKVDMKPAKGAVAWWDAGARIGENSYIGQYGHVAVVLGVNEAAGTVDIEQYNGGTVEGNPKTASYSTFTTKIEYVSGYIHVADVK